MTSLPRLLWEYIVASYFRWWFGIVTAGITLITTYEWLTTKTVPIPIWARLTFGGTALLIAPFFAYRELAEKLARVQMGVGRRRAELHIIPASGSRFILYPNRQDRAKLVGMFIALHLAVENKGERNSIISSCDFYVQQTGQRYVNQKPTYKQGVQGRKVMHSFDPSRWLLRGDLTTVEAVNKIGPGILQFYVAEIPSLDCLRINCTLTLSDTEGNKVSHKFELADAERV